MRDVKAFIRTQVEPLGLSPDREAKVIDEWAAQLEDAYDALITDGWSDEEAWRELQRHVPDWSALGAELLVAEPALTRFAADTQTTGHRSARAWLFAIRERLSTGLMRDVRAGVRLLSTDRAFSLTIILTLAICLGANAAIFSVVHAVLLRPLPIPEADRIVGFGDVYPTITPNDILANDAPSYFDRLGHLPAVEEQALFSFWFDTIAIDGVPEEIRGVRTTPSLFRLLRVPPALGRAFTEAEGEAGAEHKVILTHGLWQRLFGGDPSAIGQSIRLGFTGHQYTVVGVMPQGFTFFDDGYDGHSRSGGAGVQFFIPLPLGPQHRADTARTRYGYFHFARLEPGATIEQLQAQIDALNVERFKRFPQFAWTELGVYTAVTPLRDALTRDVRRILYLLWAGAACVLLVGVINIANLALARGRARARELATRLALGARGFQVRRQLIIEGVVPAAIGGVAGLSVGWALLRTLASRGLQNLPGADGISIEWTVVGVIAALSVLVGAAIGCVPNTGAAVGGALTDGGRSGTSGRASRLFGRGLVVTQVGLSLVLLVGAALLATSLRHLLDVDPGFSADRVVSATIFPPPSRYADARAIDAFVDRVLTAVRRVPGVQAAGVTTNIALSGFASPTAVSTFLGTPPPGTPTVVPSVVAVTPGYFEAMSTPLVRGRYFADSDRADTMRVAIVDELLAARLWPNDDPIGKRIYRGSEDPYSIVGVVRNVKFEGLTANGDLTGTAYFPHAQAPPMPRLRWIAIKSAADFASLVRAVRGALKDIDPGLPLGDVQTMTERTARSLAPQSLATRLASMFGVVTLLLSMLGIYAVLTYVVSGRTREIGIRMALGGTISSIFRLVLREGLTFIGIGLVLGCAGAIATGRFLESQLSGVEPNDPWILAFSILVTATIAVLACVAPALRATHVDPVKVLAQP